MNKPMKNYDPLRQMPMNPPVIKAMVDALILEYPEMKEDDDLLAATIEGETNVHEMLERLLDRTRAAQMMQEAIHNRIDMLKNRESAYELREQYVRKLMLKIMEAAQVRKVALTEATLSVRPAPVSVRIVMDSLIPAEFMKPPRPPEPSLSKIKAAIQAGEHVPGAELSNQHDTLAILTR